MRVGMIVRQARSRGRGRRSLVGGLPEQAGTTGHHWCTTTAGGDRHLVSPVLSHCTRDLGCLGDLATRRQASSTLRQFEHSTHAGERGRDGGSGDIDNQEAMDSDMHATNAMDGNVWWHNVMIKADGAKYTG